MIEFILALAMLNAMDQNAPQMLKPYDSREGCMVEAEKRNKSDERLRSDQARVLGAEFVCLKIERVLL